MALDFKSIASKKIADVEKPPLPPVGDYRWQVTKIPEIREVTSDKGAWDAVEFQVRAVEALDNVDMSDYNGKIEGITNRVSFMFDKNDEVNFGKTEYRLRTFLEKHLGVADESMSMSEALNASLGAQFIGTLRWDEDKRNAGEFNANISKTAPLA